MGEGFLVSQVSHFDGAAEANVFVGVLTRLETLTSYGIVFCRATALIMSVRLLLSRWL